LEANGTLTSCPGAGELHCEERLCQLIHVKQIDFISRRVDVHGGDITAIQCQPSNCSPKVETRRVPCHFRDVSFLVIIVDSPVLTVADVDGCETGIFICCDHGGQVGVAYHIAIDGVCGAGDGGHRDVVLARDVEEV